MRRAILSLVLTTLCVTPASHAETVVGAFEGNVTGMNAGTGVVGVIGWALASTGVKRVIIQVDGSDVGQAFFGFEKPQITAEYPGFPDTAHPGFVYNLNSVPYSNGNHVVSAKVITHGGASVVLPGTRNIHFTNNTSILVPFGKIERPQKGAQVFGTCGDHPPNLTLPRRYTVVEGWALDLGVEIGDAGLGWVELLVDGAIVADSILGDILFDGIDGYAGLGACTFDVSAGGLSNCYGLPRPDVERSYPFAFNAPNAGYRFVLDIGALIEFIGYSRGHHVLTIRAGDIIGQLANVAEIPVSFFCAGDFGNEGAFGEIESPGAARILSGQATFKGWALDGEGIAPLGFLDVYIDGKFRGKAEYAIGRRQSVERQYPGYPDSLRPAWRFRFDTTTISDGFHDLQVFVTDTVGDRDLIGERRFVVDNIPGD